MNINELATKSIDKSHFRSFAEMLIEPAKNILNPATSVISQKFAPITSPAESGPAPLSPEMTATITSGISAPAASMKNPMKKVDIL